MSIDISKKWVESRIDSEEGYDISAGASEFVKPQSVEPINLRELIVLNKIMPSVISNLNFRSNEFLTIDYNTNIEQFMQMLERMPMFESETVYRGTKHTGQLQINLGIILRYFSKRFNEFMVYELENELYEESHK